MFFNPFVQSQQFEFWTKAMKDHAGRFEAMQKEVERLEQQTFERATSAVDESAKLARESVAYSQKLAAEWRKISLEAMKKTAETFGVGL